MGSARSFPDMAGGGFRRLNLPRTDFITMRFPKTRNALKVTLELSESQGSGKRFGLALMDIPASQAFKVLLFVQVEEKPLFFSSQ